MSEREPITGELRAAVDYAPQFLAPDVAQVDAGEFDRCCDAIDAVHAALEAENAGLRAKLDEMADSMHETDAWKLGYDEGFANADDWMADNEDAMEEHGWVRLPVDANGEYIRIGDVLEWVSPDEDYKSVIRTVDAVGEQSFFAWSKEGGRYAQYDAHAYRHHHAPTVEDVLAEFAAKLMERGELTNGGAQTISEYAAKLRLAGDAE